MTYSDLDSMIDRLEEYLPDRPHWFSKNYRSDWKSFWIQVKEVQAGFKSGVRYPTVEQRQVAWDRFSSLCREAKIRAEDEQTVLEAQSKEHRDNILFMCRGITYSPVADALFFFDKSTVEHVKAWGVSLRNAMTELRDRKQLIVVLPNFWTVS